MKAHYVTLSSLPGRTQGSLSSLAFFSDKNVPVGIVEDTVPLNSVCTGPGAVTAWGTQKGKTSCLSLPSPATFVPPWKLPHYKRRGQVVLSQTMVGYCFFYSKSVMGTQRLINCVCEQKLTPAMKIKKSRVPSDGTAVVSRVNPPAVSPSPFPASALGLSSLFTGSMKGENPQNKHIDHFSSGFGDSGREIISQSVENSAFHI